MTSPPIAPPTAPPTAPTTGQEPILSIKGLSKRFGAVTVLEDISLDIEAGEIFSLLGPSGCGKSTLLRLVAGFEVPTSGSIRLDGEDMAQLPPNRRPVNMVFQSYAVFPHMNVLDNVAYGLVADRVPRADIDRRVAEALAQVQLDTFAKRKPGELSGGQRQRVALARALVKRPRLLLLDEPLSALDAKLRDAMRLELVKLQESVGITFVIVTHDQSEAMAMSDRIAILEGGHLRQVGSPAELYRRPSDAFVADFIGSVHAFGVQRIDVHADASPASNTLDITADRLGSVRLSMNLPEGMSAGAQAEEGPVLVVRPEHVSVTLAEPPHGVVSLVGQLGDIAYQGSRSIVEVQLADGGGLSAIVDASVADQLQAAADEVYPGTGSGTDSDSPASNARSGSSIPISAWWPPEAMHLLPRQAARTKAWR